MDPAERGRRPARRRENGGNALTALASAPGFTLIELLAVIFILALLIAIALPTFGRARQHARTTKCIGTMKGICNSIIAYGTQYKQMPPVVGEMPKPNSEDAFYNHYWSGVLIRKRFISLSDTYCTNPYGYTGGSREGFHEDDLKLKEVPPLPDYPSDSSSDPFWAPDDDDSPGYDYSMAWSLLGPHENGPTPRTANSVRPSKCVLVSEFNYVLRNSAAWNQDNGDGPGSLAGAMGGSGACYTRHIYSKYGGNNFAFADGHVSTVEARFEDALWNGWANDGRVREVYPMIEFYRGPSDDGWSFLAWAMAN